MHVRDCLAMQGTSEEGWCLTKINCKSTWHCYPCPFLETKKGSSTTSWIWLPYCGMSPWLQEITKWSNTSCFLFYLFTKSTLKEPSLYSIICFMHESCYSILFWNSFTELADCPAAPADWAAEVIRGGTCDGERILILYSSTSSKTTKYMHRLLSQNLKWL